MSWNEHLKQVREVTLGAYAHQELPFGRLAHALDQEGSVKGDSLIQVLLNYQNLSFPPADCLVLLLLYWIFNKRGLTPKWR